MAQGTLSIHSKNILSIIKRWLYSDKEIFLRELISNSSDAIYKLKVLQNQGKTPSSESDSFRIDITLDKSAKTLTIADNGLGMTAEEVEKYIAQVAFSGAEDFLAKYQSPDEKDHIIGHFGLGFYSAYMVAEKVTIDTLSHQNIEAVFWSCDGSSQYSLEKGSRSSRGTTVTLFIDKDHEEFLDEHRLRAILLRYCPFLPYPIYLNDSHINNKDPLWLKTPSEVTEKEYLTFYHDLYPTDPDPVFWVHLNVDYPFHLKGILYFPKTQRHWDTTSSAIKFFCNRVFVSDNCRDLLPDHLMVLKGAMDSAEIPLNVSRSYLQMDKTVRQLGSHITKKICDHLSQLYISDKEKFTSIWPDIEVMVKLGILQDEKFYERAKNFLIWKTLKNSWVTLDDYLSQPQQKETVLYTQKESPSPLLLETYQKQEREILEANPHIDIPLIAFLESKLPSVKFQRIDGALDPSLLDPSREKNLLDPNGISESSKIASFVQQSLEQESLEVEAKSLSNDSLPGFVLLKEEERRLRDYLSISLQKTLPTSPSRTFIVNTNNKLLLFALSVKERHPELAKTLLCHLYDLTLFSQKELKSQDLPHFLAQSYQVLEKLVSLQEMPKEP